MGEVKNIETYYNGFKFRSRLEARWAVFFDAASIKYEYEPEGFKLDDGTCYLPDFYLPEYKWYAEVKAQRDGIDKDMQKMIKFVGHGIDVLLLLGNIPPEIKEPLWHYHALYYNTLREEVMCGFVLLDCDIGEREDASMQGYFDTGFAVDRAHEITEGCFLGIAANEFSKEAFKAFSDRQMHEPLGDRYGGTAYVDVKPKFMIDALKTMYRKARTARFEYGETPRVNKVSDQSSIELIRERMATATSEDELGSLMSEYAHLKKMVNA